MAAENAIRAAASRAWSRTRSGGATAVRPTGWVVLMVSTPLVAADVLSLVLLVGGAADTPRRVARGEPPHQVPARSCPWEVPSGTGEVPQMATRGSGLETW